MQAGPSSSLRKPSLGVIFLTVLLDLLGFGLVLPFLSLQATEAFGTDASTALFLGAVYSAMQFLFMPLWGRLSDRVGRRPIMLSSIAASALSMAALGLCLAYGNSIVWLFVTRALGGVATANIGTASAYIADITTPEERVKGMGMIGMAFGIGFIVGPGVGGVLADVTVNGRHGPIPCFLAAVLSLVNFVWAYTSLPESLPPERRAQARALPRTTRIEGLRTVLTQAGIGYAAVSNFLIILAFSGLEIAYALFAKQMFGFTQREVGGLFVFMGFIGALVQGVFMRRAAGRFRESSLTLVGVLLMMLGFAGIAAGPSFGAWFLLLASASLAVGNGFTQPSISAYISRLADPARQGEMLSGNQSMASLGRVFGPLLAGQLYGMSAKLPFVGGAAINVLALLVALGMRHIQPPARSRTAGPAVLDS